MPGDMRNRIVGSRIMKDGGSPYFYIWKEGDTVRYYDTYIPPNSIMSPATSTPFFHKVNGLIADLPQYQFNSIWLLIEYFSLGACLVLAMLAMPLTRYKNIYYFLAGITVAFTYTVGWRIHIYTGQNYIFVPVLAMACYYAMAQKKGALQLVLFGAAACSLILLRPITALIFLPFLFYVKSYYKWFCSAAIFMILYLGYAWNNPVQKKNWADYFKSVQTGIAVHQQLLPPVKLVPYNPVPIYSFEGVDFNTEGNEKLGSKMKLGAENSNFFIFYNELTGHKISVAAMTVIGLFTCLVLLLPLLIITRKKIPFSLIQLFLLGFIIYNTYEFCTPVTRLAYHWVQFLFPLLLIPLFSRRLYIIPTILLIAGFCLNIAVLPSVKMEHTIGEFLIVTAMLYLVYRELIMKKIWENKMEVSNNIYIV